LLQACKKEEVSYFHTYKIMYFHKADSFSAVAAFILSPSQPDVVALTDKESVTFNGKEPDYVEDNIYSWTGHGRPGNTFVFTRKKQKLTNTVPTDMLGQYGNVFPTVVSKAEGFKVDLNDYQNAQRRVYVRVGDADGRMVNVGQKNGVVTVTPSEI